MVGLTFRVCMSQWASSQTGLNFINIRDNYVGAFMGHISTRGVNYTGGIFRMQIHFYDVSTDTIEQNYDDTIV